MAATVFSLHDILESFNFLKHLVVNKFKVLEVATNVFKIRPVKTLVQNSMV